MSNNGVAESFKEKIFKDFRNRENWKLKFIYFFHLSGIIILWAQLTIHPTTLGLSERDVASFMATSAVLTMVVPFAAGVVADKVGNFTFLLSTLTLLMGLNAFLFTLIPPIKTTSSPCVPPQPDATTTNTADLDIRLSTQEFSTQILDFCSHNESNADPRMFGLSAESVVGVNCSEVRGRQEKRVEYSVHSAEKGVEFNKKGAEPERKGEEPKHCLLPDPRSYRVTYWSYMGIRTSFLLLTATSFTLFDGAVMALDKETAADYGLQRAWGTLAALVSSFIGGVLVDFYSQGKETKDYTLIFFGSGICCTLAGIVMSSISMKFKLPAANFTKDFLKEVYNFEVIALLAVVLFKGVIMGYTEAFMYLFMSGLGASPTLISSTVTVGAFFEILLQLLATPITDALGKVFVIAFGMFLYAVRLVGFSLTYDPRVVLGLEVLDSWASGLTTTVTNMYCAAFSSTATIASFRGLIGALHDGVGKFLGIRVGIEIKEFFGDRPAWQLMAGFSLLVSIAYALALALHKKLPCGTLNRDKYHLNSPQERRSDNPKAPTDSDL